MINFSAKTFSNGVLRGMYGALVACTLAATLLMSTTASHAGLTISDQRYWPNQARSQTTYAPFDAQASTTRPSRVPATSCRYEGGPKVGEQLC